MKKIYKEIISIALPAMGENVLQMMMGMVDSYLVAGLGMVALSGVSVANNILAIYQALFIALAAAVSARLAQSSNQGEQVVGTRMTESLKLTLLVSGILGLVAILAGPSLLALLGAEAAVVETGGLYFTLVGGAVVFLGLMTSLSAILRSLGRPALPMYVSLLSNLLNILLSAFAVFVLHAGVAGIAVGTVLSRLIGCLLLWSQLPVPLAEWTWSMDKDLVRLALPAAGERLMMRAGDVMVVSLIVSLGTAVLAGNAIGETLTQFNYMPAMGVATALVILTARYRKDKTQVARLLQAGLFLSVGCMVLVAGLAYLFGPQLTRLYTEDILVGKASQTVLFYSLFGVPVTAATLILTALWQGLGNAKLPFFATSLGMWLVRILGALILVKVFKLGLDAIWIATILDNAFRAGFLYICYKKWL
ncbi:MATE family efflux transporter [Streptococcus suis]|uniref:MATE family efflux transporter n=1 Tax=Streptococcus suis TaxID=1307 RepID=UPI0015523414|nr:MATE family efflux transporter [Streptococcus suis]NQP65535.1 MATE family efflux transporter [Streptococcus suis]UUM56926.1 MATE family efflux transporter [Streptococcus suis]HEL2576855.1 MATE family efflux transporter [Streptococcus suis]